MNLFSKINYLYVSSRIFYTRIQKVQNIFTIYAAAKTKKLALHKFYYIWPCTFLRFTPTSVTRAVSSHQATLRHTKGFTYRCFLPDLAGFMNFRCAGPNNQHYLLGAVLTCVSLSKGIQPCYCGLQVTGHRKLPV